jgi:hypothetical protein
MGPRAELCGCISNPMYDMHQEVLTSTSTPFLVPPGKHPRLLALRLYLTINGSERDHTRARIFCERHRAR